MNTFLPGKFFLFVALAPLEIGFLTGLVFAFAPLPARAATFEVSGWIPYWRTATGTADALVHLDSLTEINPFGYIVQKDGSLYDAMGIDKEPWASLIAAAKAKKVRVIPTVMWSDTNAIHKILSRQSTRIALEDRIAALAREKGFDGIDIDFENKRYEDREYFSTFLRGLYIRMGNKWVMCTIEPRTPVSSRYDTTPPPDATHYVNDYVAINKYCDRVRIMAYDQGTIDVKLSAAQNGQPYIPVADLQWVGKVMTLAAETISKKKLMLGIPTYGYEYQVLPLSKSGYRYDLQWAFNPRYALELAASLGITPVRNSAGEMSFLYTPPTEAPVEGSYSVPLPPPQPLPATTTMYAAAFAGPSRLDPEIPQNILWWSDASAIQNKIDLAKRLGVRGVSLFKIDGGEDPALWAFLPKK